MSDCTEAENVPSCIVLYEIREDSCFCVFVGDSGNKKSTVTHPPLGHVGVMANEEFHSSPLTVSSMRAGTRHVLFTTVCSLHNLVARIKEATHKYLWNR